MANQIDITRLRVNRIENQGRLVGAANVSINDAFQITGIRIIRDNETGNLYVTYPSRRSAQGRFFSIANPVNEEVRLFLQEAIVNEYNKLYGEQ